MISRKKINLFFVTGASGIESTLVAKSASVLCIERETIAGARAASSGENCGGGGSTSRAITHRDPRSSPISLACSLGTYSEAPAQVVGHSSCVNGVWGGGPSGPPQAPPEAGPPQAPIFLAFFAQN